MKLAKIINNDVMDALSVGESLVYNEMLKHIEFQNKKLSKMYSEICGLSNRLMDLESDFVDLEETTRVNDERISSIEDCVYDEPKIDVGSDIEDISLCMGCWCMTHTEYNKCKKCGKPKNEVV